MARSAALAAVTPSWAALRRIWITAFTRTRRSDWFSASTTAIGSSLRNSARKRVGRPDVDCSRAKGSSWEASVAIASTSSLTRAACNSATLA